MDLTKETEAEMAQDSADEAHRAMRALGYLEIALGLLIAGGFLWVVYQFAGLTLFGVPR